MKPAELVVATRRELGLSQRQLALRAGMTQAAVSRIERGKVSPSFLTLRELMLAMGREPELTAKRLTTEWDPLHMKSTLARSPEQRLQLALGWNRLASRLAAAGARAGRMPEPPLSDPERVFAVLDARGVEYVVVGDLAVQVHGHVRMTNDLDLIPAPSRENMRRLANALKELGARVLNPGNEGARIDARMLPRATLWQFATAAGDVDVLHEAPGSASFVDLRRRALEVSLGSLRIPFAGRDDLISMKRAAGRPVDLDDVAALTEPDGPAA